MFSFVQGQADDPGLFTLALLWQTIMIFTTESGKSFDTQTDLTAPERHILQKLFLWETMATSIQQFRDKKDEALASGWNNSGPISESPALKSIISELETRLVKRMSFDAR